MVTVIHSLTSPKRKRGALLKKIHPRLRFGLVYFGMSSPLAYFLTWTTHGTWLHGDERGSIDKKHNARHSPVLTPDSERITKSRDRMGADSFMLVPDAKNVVDQTVRDHCAFREWELPALNVRSNHVHVVVRCPQNVSPETAMSQFKAWATRRLREAGHLGTDAKAWTEHGSTRWINTESSLASAVDYVMNHQD
ncbi:MAG: hypothetical protein COB69_09065 [Phycisphaera sp.]|nr:MAG: hypothetical protein COB69_09065 [Phycisphaera sp.]